MKVKLFCIPYAGGSAVIYNRWKQYLQAGIELRPIELAGRGRRIQETPYHNWSEAVEDIFGIIKDEIYESRFMLFGHSLGALLTYELAQLIRKNGLPRPDHVFFSGSGAPHLRDKKNYHLLGDEEFKDKVLRLGGTPRELFDHPELIDMFVPLLKNDFMLAEAKSFLGVTPLQDDITVLLGKEDDLTAEQCEEWRRYTQRSCQLRYFKGGHFFINDETRAITDIINNVYLSRSLPSLSLRNHGDWDIAS